MTAGLSAAGCRRWFVQARLIRNSALDADARAGGRRVWFRLILTELESLEELAETMLLWSARLPEESPMAGELAGVAGRLKAMTLRATGAAGPDTPPRLLSGGRP
jgi:hypothetical protein